MVGAMVRAVTVGRVVLVGVLAALPACDQTENDRPPTLPYITLAILQPYCAQGVCHSSYRKENGYAFDTVDAARESLLIGRSGAATRLVNPDEPETSLLYTVLIRKIRRMPYDAPLPDKDIELIRRWIEQKAASDLGLAP